MLSDLMISQEEKTVIDRILKCVSGNVLLQIGGPADDRLIHLVRVTKKILLDQDERVQSVLPYIQANSDCLPVESCSMDFVLLLHQLGNQKKSQAILQEAYRVLKPNGKIVVLNLNRFSLWNAINLFCSQKNFSMQGEFYSAEKTKKILRKLACEINLHQTICFHLPGKKAVTPKWWYFSETLGQFFFPYFGGVFVILATKQVVGLTPLVDNEWEKKLGVQNI